MGALLGERVRNLMVEAVTQKVSDYIEGRKWNRGRFGREH